MTVVVPLTFNDNDDRNQADLLCSSPPADIPPEILANFAQTIIACSSSRLGVLANCQFKLPVLTGIGSIFQSRTESLLVALKYSHSFKQT